MLSFYKKKYIKLLIYIFFTFLINLNSSISIYNKSLYPIINLNEIKSINTRNMNRLLKYLTDPEVRGFLNFLSTCEGTSRITNSNCHKPNLEEYKICFTGVICKSLKKHPGSNGTTNKALGTDKRILISSAAGRYQFLIKTWNSFKNIFNKHNLLKNNKTLVESYIKNIKNIYCNDISKIYKKPNDLNKYEFGPFQQDLAAIILLDTAGIIDSIKNNNYTEAIFKSAPIWASLPSSYLNKSYYQGQPSFSSDKAEELCKKKIKEAKSCLKLDI
jgi:muramidase (phage lysozyme)